DRKLQVFATSFARSRRTQRVMLETCRLPLRDTTGRDEPRANQGMPARIAPGDDSGRRFGQQPARRFVAARDALQKHPSLAELHEVVVSVQPAIKLLQP